MDRYLRAVRPLLPAAQRDDVIEELSEALRAEIAEREALLGRPLSDAEQDEILGRYGNPMIVGGRYQPDQGSLRFGRELIGRELFPFYVGALKSTFAISTAMHAAIVAPLWFWRLVTPGDVVQSFGLHFGIQFAVLTAVFCGLQAHVTRHPREWEARPAAKGRASSGSVRFGSFAEFAVLAVTLPWVHAMLGAGPVSFGVAELAPVWRAVYAPVMGGMAATMLQAAAIAVRPEWVRFRHPARAVGLVVWLGALGYVFRAGTWVVPTGPGSAREAAALNEVVFRNGLLVALTSFALALAWELVGLWREARRNP